MAEGINIVTPERRELSTKKTAPQWVLSSQSMVAGLISGGSGIVVGHPFDTIKTMQQTQTVSKTGVNGFQLLRNVWTTYGLRGLFKGLTYPVVTYGATNAAFFTGAEYTRQVFLKNKADGKLSYFQIYITGCVGGICPVAILCPTELVKIRLQDQLNTKRKLYSGSIDCTRKLWQKHGPLVFTNGMFATALRDIYTWGFYLVTFEYLRDKLGERGMHYIISELIAGGFAGTVSWTLATPFDVVKSRLQASETKLRLLDVVKALYRENGMKAFTRGMFWSAFRAFPSNSVTLFGYAEMMRWCDRFNQRTYNS